MYKLVIEVYDTVDIPQETLLAAIRHDLQDIAQDADPEFGPPFFLYERESKINGETIIEVTGIKRQEPKPIVTDQEYIILAKWLKKMAEG